LKVARRFIAWAKSQNAFVPFGTIENFASFPLILGRPYGTWIMSSPPPLAMNRQATFDGLYETNLVPEKKKMPFSAISAVKISSSSYRRGSRTRLIVSRPVFGFQTLPDGLPCSKPG
jgi:hypothetical protein